MYLIKLLNGGQSLTPIIISAIVVIFIKQIIMLDWRFT